MDLPFVLANKGSMAKKTKTDEQGTYNLLLKAAAFDRDDVAAELLDVEGSMTLSKPARLNNVDLKPGYDVLQTALACNADKVLDLLLKKSGGKLNASHVTPDGESPLTIALRHRNQGALTRPEIIATFDLSTKPEHSPLKIAAINGDAEAIASISKFAK